VLGDGADLSHAGEENEKVAALVFGVLRVDALWGCAGGVIGQ
jgi:hypothetical protein